MAMKSENLLKEYVDTDSVYNKKVELSSVYGKVNANTSKTFNKLKESKKLLKK